MKRIVTTLMIVLGLTFGLSVLTASEAMAGGHHNKQHKSHHNNHHYKNHYYNNHHNNHYDHGRRYGYRTGYRGPVVRLGVPHVHDEYCGHAYGYNGPRFGTGWSITFGN